MKKIVLLTIFIILGLFGIVFWQYSKFYDGRLHLVFCNVGQGDGIFIRTPNHTNILVDGGSDKKVMNCLSNHLPFWDKTIHLVILTHPHLDHYGGLPNVAVVYSIKSFATENIGNNQGEFTEFLQLISSLGIKVNHFYAGDKAKIKDGVSLAIVGPSKDFLEKTSPGGFIGESSEFGSVETLVQFGSFKALLTGDSQADELHEALQQYSNVNNITILQIPHHGSKTGLDEELVSMLKPKIAVVSVGKNSYGHPSAVAVNLVGKVTDTILRTDRQGDIEIVSDGKRYQVMSDK